MPSFSQRQGLKPLDHTLILNDVPPQMRNLLWSALDLALWKTLETDVFCDGYNGSDFDTFLRKIWIFFLKRPNDRFPDNPYATISSLRDYFYDCDWNEVLDFIEFCIENKEDRIGEPLENFVSRMLQESSSGYRLVDGLFIPITSEQEKEAIETALASKYTNVQSHLRAALEHFSRRDSPDYRNSIKESISAVECLAKVLSGKRTATLGDLLKSLEKDGTLHSALKNAFSALYGYTSDAQGIRHALMEESDLGPEDAQFMLTVCSAFINYVIQKHE